MSKDYVIQQTGSTQRITVPLRKDRATAMDNIPRQCSEVRTCSYWDMLTAERQKTDKQTLIAMLPSSTKGRTQPLLRPVHSTQTDPTWPSYTTRSSVTRVSVATWLFAAKLGRLVLGQFECCEHTRLKFNVFRTSIRELQFSSFRALWTNL